MLVTVVILTISLALMVINFSLSKKEFSEREKPSPFECGFDPISSARLPFSIQFFLIAVIFLIFDVELTLILPAVTNMFCLGADMVSLILLLFMVVLLVGLYLEWTQKSLEWYL